MTEDHWAEIGAALRKANAATLQPEPMPHQSENDASQDWDGGRRFRTEPYKFSWLTMKLLDGL